MKVQQLSFKYEGPVFSPFTGKRADSESGPNTRDASLLFVYYGDAGDYAHISKRVTTIIADAEALEPEALAKKLKMPGLVLFEVDAGWNGINYYAFAPVPH